MAIDDLFLKRHCLSLINWKKCSVRAYPHLRSIPWCVSAISWSIHRVDLRQCIYHKPWIPSSNQTWLSGKSPIYIVWWFPIKDPPFSSDMSQNRRRLMTASPMVFLWKPPYYAGISQRVVMGLSACLKKVYPNICCSKLSFKTSFSPIFDS